MRKLSITDFLMCVLQLFYRTPMNGYFWHVTYTQRKKQQRKQTFILNVINPTTATCPLNSWFLTRFMPLVSFYTPWKHPKTRSFLVLWGVLKETSSEDWVNWERIKFCPIYQFSLLLRKLFRGYFVILNLQTTFSRWRTLIGKVK